MKVPAHERGAALLAVLMLVGVMAAIAATMLERSRMATQLASNALVRERGAAMVQLAEILAVSRLDTLVRGEGRRQGSAWQGQPVVLPLPGGSASVTPRDGANCFNLNSLVVRAGPEALVTRPVGVAQFFALMRMIDVTEPQARQVASAAADWIDSDQTPAALGAEDARYAGLGYRTGGTLMAEPSELRAVAGVDAGLYARLQPWLCALPLATLSPLNVNTLVPAQAPLLAMLMPETMGPPPMRLRLARQILGERPRAGWGAVGEFVDAPLLRDTPLPSDVQQQLGVRTEWFALALAIDSGGRPMQASLLVDSRRTPARVALRQWTGER
ncbi:type II secretion system minor pseudopilin GspK [Polymorphobacter sp.]|uniref:type II secretion system minor pseudopilin GspK n=1 Tax=Polymorphobacter sp. TaxID=1909290 RepID=UPI003F726048